MFAVEKTSRFCLAHFLPQQKFGTCKCRAIHGHNYKYTVRVETRDLSPDDMVIDFGFIKTAINEYFDETLDHSILITWKHFNVDLLTRFAVERIDNIQLNYLTESGYTDVIQLSSEKIENIDELLKKLFSDSKDPAVLTTITCYHQESEDKDTYSERVVSKIAITPYMPTAERIAYIISRKLRDLTDYLALDTVTAIEVKVYETEDSCAIYREEF